MIPVFLYKISTVKSFLIFEVPVNTQHCLFLSASSSSSSTTTYRYRSITKQFFRKADGVVVMYDITAQQSFTAVRQWLTSVKVRQKQSHCAAHISQNFHRTLFTFVFLCSYCLSFIPDSSNFIRKS